jgi:hypothetical protein
MMKVEGTQSNDFVLKSGEVIVERFRSKQCAHCIRRGQCEPNRVARFAEHRCFEQDPKVEEYEDCSIDWDLLPVG